MSVKSLPDDQSGLSVNLLGCYYLDSSRGNGTEHKESGSTKYRIKWLIST